MLELTIIILVIPVIPPSQVEIIEMTRIKPSITRINCIANTFPTYLLNNSGEVFCVIHILSRTSIIDKPCRVW